MFIAASGAVNIQGGGGENPVYQNSYAKNRRFRTTDEIILPPGALVIDIYNSGLFDITLEIFGVNGNEILGLGMRYNFQAIQNPVDLKFELSKQVTATPAAGQPMEVMVIYPQSSTVDLDELEN